MGGSISNLLKLLKELDKTQWDKRDWPRLKGPILTRYALQNKIVPKGDFVSKTSGATGIPIEIQRTNLSKLWWSATNIREVLWYKRDLSLSFAVIRPHIGEEVSRPGWGAAFSQLGSTGPLYGHPVSGDLNGWLQKIQPGYLSTFPSILESIDLTALPSLRGIKTTGETLLQKHPLIADMYSSEEVGTIAIQCPDNGEVYHVMENILVELLDENDNPAEVGRVVVTDLTSLYLHRYDIGDYAERGICPCGRGLQVIKKILGRRRNRVCLPDGSRHWPRIGSNAFRDYAPVRRFQAAQIEPTVIELRLVVEAALSSAQEEKIAELVQKFIGYPFEIRFRYLDAFPAGKFEEFVSLLESSS